MAGAPLHRHCYLLLQRKWVGDYPLRRSAWGMQELSENGAHHTSMFFSSLGNEWAFEMYIFILRCLTYPRMAGNYAVEGNLELLILLPLPAKCWDNECVLLPPPVYAVLETDG